MDWAKATLFDRVIHGLWLDPDEVRAKFDLEAIGNRQRLQNEALIREWHKIAPGSDATVIEFDFRAAGNSKRKLLRRLDHLHHSKCRGGLTIREAMSLEMLDDFALAYEIVALGCAGALLGWRFLRSPIPTLQNGRSADPHRRC